MGRGRAAGCLLLGVPNQGTFLIPQILTGQGEITHRLDQIDQRQNHLDIVRTFRSFVSLYQLLPRPEEQFAHLYEPETYLGSLQPHGQTDEPTTMSITGPARSPRACSPTPASSKPALEGTIDARRTVAVSAYGIPTVVDYDRLNVPNLANAWLVSKDGGDGIVPLQLARPDIDGVREYFVRDEHAALISNPKLLSSLTRLLEEGRTETLPDQPPKVLPGKPLEGGGGTDNPATKRIRSLGEIGATHLASRRCYPEPDEPTVEEREVGERLTRDLSGGQAELLRAEPTRVTPRTVAIEIGLIHGTIDQVDALLADTGPPNPPVDALAVGLYVGEKPSGSTLKLDRAISKAFLERTGRELTDDSPLPERDLILTQFALRGLIRGELGQPFFLTDPRVSDVSEALPGRLIAVVGMGVAGPIRRPGTDRDGPRAVLGHRPGGQEAPGGRGARHEGQQPVSGGSHIGLGPGHHVRPRRGGYRRVPSPAADSRHSTRRPRSSRCKRPSWPSKGGILSQAGSIPTSTSTLHYKPHIRTSSSEFQETGHQGCQRTRSRSTRA